ncbi:MAG: MerR family transcriptional regulator [Pseudomonadota bacterium]
MDDSFPNETLDIRELVQRTGLTSRALRFYEARGLLHPLRSHSGRRFYGTAQLERVHQIIVLKSAGLSLSQIKRLFDGKVINLTDLLHAQLTMLDEQASEIDRARSRISFALSRIARSEPLDAATFCSLIESGDRMMEQEPKEWKEVTDRYFSPAQKAEWAQKWAELPADYDPEADAAKWKDLGGRIKDALPLEPDSAVAQNFVDEWNALLKPMAEMFTPEMWDGTMRMYEDMDNWAGEGEGQLDPGFDKQVWDFINEAMAARMATDESFSLAAPGASSSQS